MFTWLIWRKYRGGIYQRTSLQKAVFVGGVGLEVGTGCSGLISVTFRIARGMEGYRSRA